MAQWRQIAEDVSPQTTIDGNNYTMLLRWHSRAKSYAVVDLATGDVPPADTRPSKMTNYI